MTVRHDCSCFLKLFKSSKHMYIIPVGEEVPLNFENMQI